MEETQILEYFKENGIPREQILQLDENNSSVLYYLARRNFAHLEILIQWFGIKFSDLLVLNHNKNNAFMWMCWYGCGALSSYIKTETNELKKHLLNQNSFGKSAIEGICYSNKYTEILLDVFLLERNDVVRSNLQCIVWLCLHKHKKLQRIIEEFNVTREDLLLKNSNGDCAFDLLCHIDYYELPKIIEELKITREDLVKMNSDGNTPLIRLCSEGYSELPKIIANLNITREDLLQKNSDGYSPFHVLCFLNYSEIPKIIEDLKITRENLLQTDIDGETALHLLCKNYSEIAKIIRDLNITRKDLLQKFDGDTSLHFLCSKNYEILNIIQDLKITRNDLLQKSSDGDTHLFRLCYEGYSELPKIIEELKFTRTDLLQESCDGNTPLFRLCYEGYSEIPKIIENLRITREDLLQENLDGNTPLHLLCSRGYSEIPKIIEDLQISTGDVLQKVSYSGYTPFHLLCSINYSEIPKIIENLKITREDLLQQSFDGYSPFYRMCSGNYEFQKIIEDFKITRQDLFKEYPDGYTPFYRLCYQSYSKLPIIEDFKITREDLLQKNSDGYTRFHLLCSINYSEIPKIIENLKITREDLLQQSFDGYSPFYRMCSGNYEFQKIIEDFKITRQDLFKEYPDGYTPFYRLCYQSYSKLPKIIEDFKITREDLLQKNSGGETPFSRLCSEGYSELPKIIQYSEITREDLQKDSNGWTPLHRLCRKNISIVPNIVDLNDLDGKSLTTVSVYQDSILYHVFKHNINGIDISQLPWKVLKSVVFSIPLFESSSALTYLISDNSPYLSDLSIHLSASDLKKQDSGRSYLCSICRYAQPVLETFLENVSDFKPSDFKEIHEQHSLMYYLSANDYIFPRNLWDCFPCNLSTATIKELVRYQSWFLAKVITSKESRDVILQISPSLLLYLDIRFGKEIIEIPQQSSFISTEFDPIQRTCSLYWMEEYKLDMEGVPKSELKFYNEDIKPMLYLTISGSITGSGATSKLYECLYKKSKHALKLIAEDSLSSGEQEIKILKMIGSHPNICGMIDSCVYSSSIKIVLPLYRGDLYEMISNSALLPVKTVVHIIQSILKALSHLDSKRIIHGDVKPANILFKESKSIFEVALCDFGLSRKLPDGKDFCTDHCYGTEEYFSPERHERCFGPKSDVYSLGIVFYELLYGEYPERKNGIQFPISKRIPESVQSVLKEMLQLVHKRPSASQLLKHIDWQSIESEVWKEPEKNNEMHNTSQSRTILPGPNIAGLRVSDKYIGKGAFGEVYEGTFQYRDKKQKKIKAIKIAVKKIPKSKYKKLGLKEIKASQRIKPYQHLCRVYKCSEDKEYFYIAMELCPSNYRAFLERKDNDNTVIHLHLQQILKGVRELHKQKIAHRDMKPENILISRSNTIKIADFGLSKALSSIQYTNVGTRCYKAPEIREGLYGLAVDIWAIGIIYLEMLGMNIREEFSRIKSPIIPGSIHDSGLSATRESDNSRDWDVKSKSSKTNESSEKMPTDNYGRLLPRAFAPGGWVPKLHDLVTNSTYHDVSKEFLLSIFVPEYKRPTAHNLLEKYVFSRDGISRYHTSR